MRHVLLTGALVLSFSASAWGNAFDESRPYRFPTTGDRFNNAYTLDIIEKKKGGFYDGFNTTNNNTYITNHNGDVINCTVQASAIGNQHIPSMSATTGSNVLSPQMTQTASAQGNGATNNATNTSSQSTVATGSSSNNTANDITGGNNASGSDFSFGSDDQNTVNNSGGSSTVSDQLSNNQNNSGNQSTQFTGNNNNFAPGNVSADGNTTNQTLNNTQNNSGNQSASVTGSTGCTFND